ncbi:MAG: FAD-binding protein [Dehalococcoidia bacterium]|nr:FAD-binding protein [Dehalococcoidia bacterium]
MRPPGAAAVAVGYRAAMLLDARALPDESTLDADLCIVGAGPAGLTLAHELRDAHLRILLVESGGDAPHPSTEALNEVEAEDSDLEAAIDTRARAIGGSAHRWNVFTGGLGDRVRYVPLTRQDFEARAWFPGSGWPFTRADLEPYYRRAHVICGLPGYGHAPEAYATPRRPLLPLDASRVETSVEWYGSPSVFAQRLPAALRGAAGTVVLNHGTATQLRFDATSTAVSGIEVRTLIGRRHTVRAGRVVLASGGIENARVLLVSTGRHPEGAGNSHGLVGRYYMDHLKFAPAELVLTDGSLFDRTGFYDIHAAGRAVLMGKLRLAASVQASEQLLNAAVRLEPHPPAYVDATGAAWHALLRSVRRRRPTMHAAAGVLRASSGLPRLLRLGSELAVRQRQPIPSLNAGWSKLARPSRHFERFALEMQLELAPRLENRVALGSRRDAFGIPVPAITWRWGEIEHRTWRRTLELLGHEFRCAGLGELRIAEDAPGRLVTPAGDNHPTGTTRMHRDPRCGVVDADGRVHGIENLYVTGSSTFPTSGYANPTLTIVAMAARLADHLRAAPG